jgi:hypothetical protein
MNTRSFAAGCIAKLTAAQQEANGHGTKGNTNCRYQRTPERNNLFPGLISDHLRKPSIIAALYESVLCTLQTMIIFYLNPSMFFLISMYPANNDYILSQSFYVFWFLIDDEDGFNPFHQE